MHTRRVDGSCWVSRVLCLRARSHGVPPSHVSPPQLPSYSFLRFTGTLQSKADAGAFAKYASLFPGISFGAAYKVLQRVYKFGGQPYVKDFLTKHFKVRTSRQQA